MFLKLKGGNYIHVDSYGCSTWGSLSQTGIEKNSKNEWVVRTVYCVDPLFDEWEHDEFTLNVEEELETLPANAELYNQDDYDSFKEMVEGWS